MTTRHSNVVSTRMGKVTELAKTELEEMNEETEGLATSTSKLREEMLALTNVDIMESDGKTFKSTYDILLEISKIWDKLSDVSQANVLEKLAGKLRSNAVAGILQNGEDLEKVLKVATEATGSAAQENARYLESIDGKLNQLATTWQKVWVDTIDSDLIKGVIDLANNILKLVDAAGGLDSILMSIATTIGIIKFDSIVSSLSKITDRISIFATTLADGVTSFIKVKEGAEAMEALSAATEVNTAATEANAVATEAAVYEEQLREAGMLELTAAETAETGATIENTVATEADTVARNANAAAASAQKLAIGLAAGVAVLAAAAIYKAYKQQQKAAEDARQATIQQSQDTISAYQDMVKAADKYKEVIGNHSHTEDELTSALEGVNTALGSKSEALKALQDDEAAYRAELDKTIEKEKEEAKLAASVAKQEAKTSLKKNLNKAGKDQQAISIGKGMNQDDISFIEKFMGERSTTISNLSGAIGFNFNYDASNANDVLAYYDKLIKLQDELNKKSEEYSKAADELHQKAAWAKSIGEEAFAESFEDQAQIYESYIQGITSFTNDLMTEITRVGDYAKVYSDALVTDVQFKYDPTSFAEYEQQLEEFIAKESQGKIVTDELRESLTTRFAQAFPEFASGVAQVQSAIDKLNAMNDPVFGGITNPLGDNWDAEGLRDYLDGLTEGTEDYITAADLATVSTQGFQEYLTNNAIDIATNDYQALAKAILGYKESIKPVIDFQADFDKALRDSKDKIDDFQSSLSSLSDVAANAWDGSDSAEEFLDGIQAISEAMGKLKDTDGINLKGVTNLKELGDVAQQVAEQQLEELIDELEKLGISDTLAEQLRKQYTEMMQYQAHINATVNSMSSLQGAYQSLRGVMDEYNETGYLTFSNIETLLQMAPEYLNLLSEENGQLVLNTEAVKQLAEQRLNEAEQQAVQNANTQIAAILDNAEARSLAGVATASNSAAQQQNGFAQQIGNATVQLGYAIPALAEYKALMDGVGSAGLTSDELAAIDKINQNLAATLNGYEKTRTKIKNGTIKDTDDVLEYTKKGAKGASGAAKDAADEIKQEIDDTLSKLKQAVEDGGITYKRYIDEARRITDRAYAEGKISAEDYHDYKMRLLREEMDMWKQVASAVNFFLDEQKDALQDELDAISERKEALQEEIDSINEYYDARIKVHEDKIKEYEKEQDKLDEQIKENNKAINAIEEDTAAATAANDEKIKSLEKAKQKVQDEIDAHQEIIDKIQLEINQIERQKHVIENEVRDIELIKRENERVIEDLEQQKKIYEDQQKLIEKIIKSYERQISLNNRVIRSLERQSKVYEKQQKAIDKQIKELQKQQKLLEKMKKPYEDQIKALNKEKEALQKANEERKRTLDLQKAKYELDRSENQRTAYVYTNGGFEYRKDQDAVNNAKDNLNDGEYELKLADYDDQIETAQNAIQALTDRVDALQESIDALNDKKEQVQEFVDSIQERIDALNDENDELKFTIDGLNDKISDLQIPIDTIQDKIDALARTNEDWDYQITLLNRDIETLDDVIYSLNEKIKEQEAIIEPLTEKTKEYDKQIEQLNRDNERLKENEEALKKPYEEHNKQLEDQKDKLDDLIKKQNEEIEKLEEERDARVKAIEDTIKALEKQEKALNKQISAIEKYAQEWQKVLDMFERMKNAKLLEDIFGPDWEQRLKSLDPSMVQQFAAEYSRAMNTLASESEKGVNGLEKVGNAATETGSKSSGAVGGVNELSEAIGGGSGFSDTARNSAQRERFNSNSYVQAYTDTYGGGSGVRGSGNGLLKAAAEAQVELPKTDTAIATTKQGTAELVTKIADEATPKATKFQDTLKATDSAVDNTQNTVGGTLIPTLQTANDTVDQTNSRLVDTSGTIASSTTAITGAVTTMTSSVNGDLLMVELYAQRAKDAVTDTMKIIESNTKTLEATGKSLDDIITKSDKVKSDVKRILDNIQEQINDLNKQVTKSLGQEGLQGKLTKAKRDTQEAKDNITKQLSLTGGLAKAVKSVNEFITKYIKSDSGIVKKSDEAKRKVEQTFSHSSGLRNAINSINKFINNNLNGSKGIKQQSQIARELIKTHWEGSALDACKRKLNELIELLVEVRKKSEEAKKAADEVANYDTGKFEALKNSLDEVIAKANEAKAAVDAIPDSKTVTINVEGADKLEGLGGSHGTQGGRNGGRIERFASGGRVKKLNISGELNAIAKAMGEDTMVAAKYGEGIFTEKQTNDLEEFIKLTPELISSTASLNKFAKLFTGVNVSAVTGALTQSQISSNIANSTSGSAGTMIGKSIENCNNVTLSIGDIHLNGVKDVEGLALDIKNNLPSTVLQMLTRR